MLKDAWQGGCFSFTNSTWTSSTNQEGCIQMLTLCLEFHQGITQWLPLKSSSQRIHFIPFWRHRKKTLHWVKWLKPWKMGLLFRLVQCQGWKRRFFKMGYFAARLGRRVPIQCVHSWWSLKVMWRSFWRNCIMSRVIWVFRGQPRKWRSASIGLDMRWTFRIGFKNVSNVKSVIHLNLILWHLSDRSSVLIHLMW